MIRPARAEDVLGMVALSEQMRLQYQDYQPQFWHKAGDSATTQALFFESQLQQENVLMSVWEQEGRLLGFVAGMLVPAPPVYDPGGLTFLIDDFVVEAEADWITVGRELLAGLESEARARGASQVVVMCGDRDTI